MKRFWSLLVIFFGLFLFKVPAVPVAADHVVGGFNIQSMAGPVVDLNVISPAALPLTDQIVIAPLDVGVEKPIINCAIKTDLMICVPTQCSDPMSMAISRSGDSYRQNQKTRYRAEGTFRLDIGER
jgi:hypothetical protein